MNLAHGHHRRKCDRHAKGRDEGEKSQTWGHCNPPGIKNAVATDCPPMIASWSRLFRERSHTQDVTKERAARLAASSWVRGPRAAESRRRANPAPPPVHSRPRPFAH